jgi:bifunctional aspartokinase / homoserine dehydrogenase 1
MPAITITTTVIAIVYVCYSMIGVPGVAQRLFGSLHQMGISVILISQASSEHSICVAIDAKHTAAATVSNSIHIYLHAQCLFR